MDKQILKPEMCPGRGPFVTTETAQLYHLKNGEILKLFSPLYLNRLNSIGISMEEKILDADKSTVASEIICPSAAYYTDGGSFIGYSQPTANGVNFNQYTDGLSHSAQTDLYRYADIHSKIESPVKKSSNIVFPDLCTCDNIFIDDNQDIQFIDYDGLQVGKHKTISMSTSLGDPRQYLGSKYVKDYYLTKELDKKSLTVLYFLDTFHADLNKIGCVDPATGKPVTLDDFFQCIQLDDWDVMDKVWKLFQNNKENEYLGEDVFRIADNYQLHTIPVTNRDCLKVLTKKR